MTTSSSETACNSSQWGLETAKQDIADVVATPVRRLEEGKPRCWLRAGMAETNTKPFLLASPGGIAETQRQLSISKQSHSPAAALLQI